MTPLRSSLRRHGRALCIAWILGSAVSVAYAQDDLADASVPPVVDADVDASVVDAEVEAQAPEGTVPPPQTGKLIGTVVSSRTRLPAGGVDVFVLGSPAQTQSDASGHFELELPPGDYTLSIAHIDYLGQTLEGVSVSAGVESELTISLQPAPADMADFIVKGRRIRGSVASVMEERRKATSVQDAIGAEDIRKSPDGTASAATRRVVGATVVGGQFLFVRGLGGRYSNVRLNGVPLPSTDPDLPGFQLDLFPASLLSSLTIAKTFTPDIPGDFAGGSMNIATRDFPDHFEVTASASLSSDTATVGRKMLSYDGGGTDFLGFDDGTRALPDEVPQDQTVMKLNRRGEGLPAAQIEDIGKAFPNHWQLKPRTALPNLGLGFSVGDTARLAGHRLGYLFTLGYRDLSSRYEETLTSVHIVGTGTNAHVAKRETLAREVGRESAQIGLLGTTSYELAKGHDLTLVSVLTQTGDDDAGRVTGYGEAEGGQLRETELRFVERQLFFNQLLGTHDFSDVKLDWQLNVDSVKRAQPDTRSVLYVDQGTGFLFGSTSGSGEHFYTDLSQTDFGGGVNLTVPVSSAAFKSGYLGRTSDRGFEGRRFVHANVMQRGLAPEDLFSPRRSGDSWVINELTTNEDGYTADETLHAAYAMLDVPVTTWLRVTGGARVESFEQSIAVTPPVASLDVTNLKRTDRVDIDALPAGSLIVALSQQMNVRLAYGGTVARPLVRELAPFVVTDFVRRREVQGNPDLSRTYINNFDVRWELFPSQAEVLSASAFYKSFHNPIEAIVLDGRGDLGFDNVASAHNYGVEFEARVNLERVAKSFDDFVLTANLALIHSRVTLAADQVMSATSKARPLAGQSPYVINIGLGYSPSGTGLSLNAFYNVFGRRILEVGRERLPDSYEEPFHSLDFTAAYQLDEHFTLGASATNLLLQSSVIDQGGFDFSRIDRGCTFGVRLGYVN